MKVSVIDDAIVKELEENQPLTCLELVTALNHTIPPLKVTSRLFMLIKRGTVAMSTDPLNAMVVYFLSALKPHLRCGHCGKYSIIVDSYTPFGNSSDIEPPDDVPLCQKCVDKDRITFHKLNFMPSRWIKAKYESQLAKELGFVEIALTGAAWSMWHNTRFPIPTDYHIVERINDGENQPLLQNE